MSIFKRTFVVSSILSLAWSMPAISNPAEEDCDPDKSSKACPQKAFPILELPGDTQAQQLRAGQAFLMHHECSASGGMLACGGWPQEQKALGRLRYQWVFESNGRRYESSPDAGSEQAIKCDAGSEVTVTLTVRNGNYQASSSDKFRCSGK